MAGRILSVVSLASALGLAAPATADMLMATLSDLEGGLAFKVTLDDAGAGAGEILVTVEVISGSADLRGIFLDIADDSLLPGMSATGADVTEAIFAASAVSDLGQGANANGDGPCPCDLGVEIGTPGMGKDDIQTTSFVLSHETEDLTVDLFDGQTVVIRATSAGGDEVERTASVKTPGTVTVPEPGPAGLLACGLVWLGVRRRAATAA